MDRVKTNAEPKWVFLIIKNWPNPASFCFFRSFHMTWSKRRCVLWTRTRSNRMVGANQSTELWRHPYKRVLIQPKEETEIEFIWSVLWYKQTDRQTITRKDWSSGHTGWKFFTYICCKYCIVCLKRLKINNIEAEVGQFFKIKLLQKHFSDFVVEDGSFFVEWSWIARQSKIN